MSEGIPRAILKVFRMEECRKGSGEDSIGKAQKISEKNTEIVPAGALDVFLGKPLESPPNKC